MLVLIGAIVGLFYGIVIGAKYGVAAKIAGAIVGMMLGGLSVVLAGFIVALILEPFDRLWRWWRPYPPVCENGTCVGYESFESVKLEEHVVEKTAGLSWLGWRCNCGNFYGGGYEFPFHNRWVRVLPNGKIRPYLIHRFLGRWYPDDGLGIPNELIDLTPDSAR